MSWFGKKKEPQNTIPPVQRTAQAPQARPAPTKTVAPIGQTIPQVVQVAQPSQKAEPQLSQKTQHGTNTTTSGLIIEDGLNNVAETAAMFFANGQYENAQSTLTAHLNETRGDTDKTIWYLLLDLYQIQRNKGQFEKLAELFAKKFGMSPPSWVELASKEEGSFSGRNVMVLEGGLNIEIADKTKDFTKVSREQKSCKIECSRVSLSESTLDGLNLWLETMKKVRQYKVQAVLMGEVGVIEDLQAYIKDESKNNQQAYWLLLLELYQWRGKEQDFEDLAFEFAIKFDMSPPGFDPAGIMKSDLFEEDLNEKQKNAPDAPAVLTEGIMNDWLDRLGKWLADSQTPVVEVPFNHVERLSFEAAGALSAWVHKDLTRAKRLRIVQPNHWVLVVMNMVNLLVVLKAVSKKSS